MTNTIVYIDVDGVINSFNESRKLTGWEGEWRLAKVTRYNIHWYTDLVESINKLDKMEGVTVKWLTTWQDKAVTELCDPLGIEGKHWDVVYKDSRDHMFDRRGGWWKLRSIINDIAISNPDQVVWIDDDFKYEIEAIEWAEHMRDNVMPILPVSPTMDFGMTKEDFDDIIEFINT